MPPRAHPRLKLHSQGNCHLDMPGRSLPSGQEPPCVLIRTRSSRVTVETVNKKNGHTFSTNFQVGFGYQTVIPLAYPDGGLLFILKKEGSSDTSYSVGDP